MSTMFQKTTPEIAAKVFNDDRSVKLPRSVRLAVRQGIANPRWCLTRQFSEEKAQAVMAAVQPIAEDMGVGLTIRQSRDGETWGVYVVLDSVAAGVSGDAEENR